MDFFYTLHQHMRWLVAIALLVAVVKLLVTWIRRSDFSALDRRLLSAAVGMIDLQVLFGLVVLFSVGGGFPRPRMEHAVTMVLAALAAHTTARWKKYDARIRARNSAIVLLIAILLVVVGVVRLKGGWM